jgi:hypothetical protein
MLSAPATSAPLRRTGVLASRRPLGLAHATRTRPPRPGRRRTLGVACRYEALLEPAIDETVRRALVTMGGAGAQAGGAGAVVLHGARVWPRLPLRCRGGVVRNHSYSAAATPRQAPAAVGCTCQLPLPHPAPPSQPLPPTLRTCDPATLSPPFLAAPTRRRPPRRVPRGSGWRPGRPVPKHILRPVCGAWGAAVPLWRGCV